MITTAATLSAQTALTVLTRNADPAVALVAPEQRQERGPAISIDVSTAKLADSAERQMERDSIAASGDVSAAAAAAHADDLRRKGVEDFEEMVVQRQRSLQQAKEIIRIYDETGELMTPQMDGSLAPLQPQQRFRSADEEQRYVEQFRQHIGNAEKVMPEIEADAARMRAEYENRGNI